MIKLLLIALGGGLGAVLRYWVGGAVQDWSRSVTFPYGTLAVNAVGCFVIGGLTCLADMRGAFTPEARLLVFTGLLGGFTTFSTFGNETFALIRDGDEALALANAGAHVLPGVGAVWAGLIWR